MYLHPAHDFFTPQPVKDAAVFLLRLVSHDWPTPMMKKVLNHLRASAQPTTKLILVDNIIPYAAHISDQFSDIPGSGSPPVPDPLLPNLGITSATSFMVDIQARNSHLDDIALLFTSFITIILYR
jgi:hypothetical protein